MLELICAELRREARSQWSAGRLGRRRVELSDEMAPRLIGEIPVAGKQQVMQGGVCFSGKSLSERMLALLRFLGPSLGMRRAHAYNMVPMGI